MSTKAVRTLKKIMFAWIVVLILLQIMGYTTSKIKDLNSNRANDKAAKNLSQSVSQALEMKDMESIFELLVASPATYSLSEIHSELVDTMFSELQDHPKFLPVVEKLVASGAYLDKSFPILYNNFAEIDNPLAVYLAYEDYGSVNRKLMDMIVSTEDTELYREIYSRTRMKIVDHIKSNVATPKTLLVKMRSFHSSISIHFAKDNHIQEWSRDSLVAITNLMRLATFYQDYNSLSSQLDSIEKDLEVWGDKILLSGYIEKVWSTDADVETYLVSNSSLMLNGRYQEASSDCLLRIKYKRFTTTGRFGPLEVFQFSSREVKTSGGFTKTIPVFEAWTESALSRFDDTAEEASATRKRLQVIERKLGFTPTKKAILKKLSYL